ncbi:MAG: tRNA (adenosine(37)-N6)-threonylcarbamoyltransferase complex ATPase subunit type 1 TsaE, partial [Opitutaceae bacterium]|nr:tRNA (adenosine(37)-N6)-threonylcarbamoyltransferase complex ATPase subunit type 1 TsaE [Opitutaceae bacterium]
MSIFDQLKNGIETNSGEETQAVAAEFARNLPPDVTIAFSGDLGVGKTTFIQGMAATWNIPDPVTSPSFNLYNIYRGENRLLVHLDAYRIVQPEQFDSLMIEDFLESPYCLAVEWPENAAGWLPADAIWLTLSIVK